MDTRLIIRETVLSWTPNKSPDTFKKLPVPLNHNAIKHWIRAKIDDNFFLFCFQIISYFS
jgi:hypothetical protein